MPLTASFNIVTTEASVQFLHVAHRQGGGGGGNHFKLHGTIKFLCICNLLQAKNKACAAQMLFSVEAAGT